MTNVDRIDPREYSRRQTVTFEAEIDLTPDEIAEAGSRGQAIQNRIGSSGAAVTDVLWPEGE